jgi:hypothetical protein
MSEEFISLKRDFSAEYKTLEVEARAVADERSLDEAIILLLTFEKKCRLNNDFPSLKLVCVLIVQMCKTKGMLEISRRVVTILSLLLSP